MNTVSHHFNTPNVNDDLNDEEPDLVASVQPAPEVEAAEIPLEGDRAEILPEVQDRARRDYINDHDSDDDGDVEAPDSDRNNAGIQKGVSNNIFR